MKAIALICLVLILSGCELKSSVTGSAVGKIPEESGREIEVYFCPRDDCEDKLYNFLNDSDKSINCALFELNLESIKKLLSEKSKKIDVKLVVDEQYYDEVSELDFARKDNSNQLSHNKFCVVDSKKVFTGSFNPTERDSYFNNNNMVLIYSEIIASNYEDEFYELWDGIFGEGDNVENPVINYNGIILKNYFCPDDLCSERVINELRKAKDNICFMTFSFTHNRIGNMLALKLSEGVSVKGVYEKKNLKDSTYDMLVYQGADVKVDDNPYNLHHKVFIIDNKTVVTGSFNPTKSGDNKNDENIIIIQDKDIAEMFLDEFEFVWNFNNTLLGGKNEANCVILYEIMYDAKGSDSGNEYVIILNNCNESVDLDYWRLSNGNNNFVLNGSLLPKHSIKFKPSFSLKNTNGLLILKDKSMNNIDYVKYAGEWEIEAKDGRVLLRNDTGFVNCKECWTVG